MALALIMLTQIFYHVPELIVGTIGITFIAVSAYQSIRANKIIGKEL